MASTLPHERLAAHLKARGWNQEDAGRVLGCSQGMISALLNGTKLPGRLLANRIERLTSARLPGHDLDVVRSEDWDEVELARRAEREGSAAGLVRLLIRSGGA